MSGPHKPAAGSVKGSERFDQWSVTREPSWPGRRGREHSRGTGMARQTGALLASIAVLAAAPQGLAGELQGQAGLSQPFPMPPDAVLDVQLIESVSKDAATVLQGRSRTPVSGRSPFAFRIRYLDAALRPSSRYQLRASIRQGDRLLFKTAASVPLPPGKGPIPPLVLEPVGDAPMRGLTWLRAPAAGVPVPPGAPRQEQQFRLDPLTRELSGSGDCNRFIGRFALDGDNLRLEPAGGTQLECEPEVKADEAQFLADLLKVRRWRLDGKGRLQLLDQNGGSLLLMETRPIE